MTTTQFSLLVGTLVGCTVWLGFRLSEIADAIRNGRK